MEKHDLIAIYLPQFHEIAENNKWWGKGYTEWNAVKNAKPFFKKHNQPSVPLNENYYDLNDVSGNVWRWQSNLARSYGINAFCIYHYWFDDNDTLLQRPMEILENCRDIKINYCVCWANENWSRNWYGQQKEILKEQKYSKQSQISQFNYLLRFFKDDRYIKVNNKPIICIYRCEDIPNLKWLKETWDRMAVENGYNGVYIVAARTGRKKLENRTEIINAFYDFQPGYTVQHRLSLFAKLIIDSRKVLIRIYNNISKNKKIEEIINAKRVFSSMKKTDHTISITTYPGIFVKWDNTPRRQSKGIYYSNTSPSLLYKQISFFISNGEKKGYDTRYIFINAWNEWGEGCYLEPDCLYRYQYLESIKQALTENNSIGEK